MNGYSWKIKINLFPPSCFWLLFYCGNKWPTGLNAFVWERLGPQMSEGRAVRLTSCPYTQGALHMALSPFTQLRQRSRDIWLVCQGPPQHRGNSRPSLLLATHDTPNPSNTADWD